MGEKSKDKEKQKEIVETALTRFKIGYEADSENREKAIEDMNFRAGDQWPESIKNEREIEKRPCLTINKIPQNVHQIVNDQRQNRPSIKVSPVDDQSDPDTSKILQGIIRNIETVSSADTAFDIAFDAAVTGGRGFFRIKTDYVSHKSFDQEVLIESIYDPHSVVIDPGYRKPDGSDANWALVLEDIPKTEFKASYPNAECFGVDFDYRGADSSWFGEETIRVAEYFEKEMVEDTLLLFDDGSTALKSEYEEAMEGAFKSGEIAPPHEIIKQRKTLVPKVHWYKINGNEVLEETIWVSRYIPIIPVHGTELWVDGKRVFEGVIRHAKDPQRMYNYWATCETESIALAPKAPWVGAEGSFEGHENKWNMANRKNFAYLEYKPTLLDNGTPVPPPQRQFGDVQTNAITQARMLSSDDLKSTTGIYDAALGNRSNESTGVAIQRRAQQAQTSNFHYIDNLSRSIRHAGRILLEIIPKIYDTERVVRIINPDDEEELVVINQVFKTDEGEMIKNDLSLGKYDCTVSTGPSYTSKRQEAVDSMLGLVQRNPQLANYISDLLVKNMDWAGADEIAERLKRTIPPEVLGDDKTAIPPEIKAQIDQQMAMIDELTKKLNEAQDEVEGKRLELESKERIETMKIQKDYDLETAKLQAKEGLSPEMVAELREEVLFLKDRLAILDINEPINEEEALGNQVPMGPDQVPNQIPTSGMLGNTGPMPTEE